MVQKIYSKVFFLSGYQCIKNSFFKKDVLLQHKIEKFEFLLKKLINLDIELKKFKQVFPEKKS